jgi:hypothetical protein
MGLFSWFNDEQFYFYVRITRYFGKCPAAVHVTLGERTDSEVLGKYSETVERYLIVDRHQHYSRADSIDTWRKIIERNAIREFRGNVQVLVCLSDLSAYYEHCQAMIDGDCLLETRLR